jgi:hypothetical protein
MATFTRAAPSKGGMGSGSTDYPTLDTLISGAIGKGTRFRLLEIACTGQPQRQLQHAGRLRQCNPSDVDPIQLYKRIFGPSSRIPMPPSSSRTRDHAAPERAQRREGRTRSAAAQRRGQPDRARIGPIFHLGCASSSSSSA